MCLLQEERYDTVPLWVGWRRFLGDCDEANDFMETSVWISRISVGRITIYIPYESQAIMNASIRAIQPASYMTT